VPAYVLSQASRGKHGKDWHCPTCTDLTQVEKDTRKSHAEVEEMVKGISALATPT